VVNLGPKCVPTLRQLSINSVEVIGYFGTGSEASVGHFSTNSELSGHFGLQFGAEVATVVQYTAV